MNNLSQTVPQTKAFQSWRLVLMAVILLAAAATSGLYIATIQAQSSNGAITGLTLTSNAPGTLTVSWEAASPTPTDYRVDWAKSDEDYQSWKVDEGHKYPAPTATSLELADLEEGVEYKVRARARFYKGEHKGTPWSGPWVEDSLLVSSTPPPVVVPKAVPKDDPPPPLPVPSAPVMWYTIIDGKVVVGRDGTGFLDASITGYQILRGPDIDSLEVIEEDAQLDVAAYTDEDSLPGQTRTYGIKARNASGLSPLSNTERISVPEAITDHESTSDTLVSNLGQTAASTSGIVGPLLGHTVEAGMAFTTGNNPFGYHLTSVQLDIRTLVGGNTNPNLSIRADTGGVPVKPSCTPSPPPRQSPAVGT